MWISRARWAAMAIASVVACAPSRGPGSQVVVEAPTIAPGASTPALTPTGASTAEAGPTVKKAAPRCPLLPLALAVQVQGQSRVFMSLDEQGNLRSVLRQGLDAQDEPIAQMDSRGCIASDDGVWVEWTPSERLWTIRSDIEVQGNRLVLPRPLEIAPDGTVRGIEKGAPRSAPLVRIEGYRPEARCAALLLLQTFVSSMPSMAVVDGNPIVLPPPDPSACPDLHQRTLRSTRDDDGPAT